MAKIALGNAREAFQSDCIRPCRRIHLHLSFRVRRSRLCHGHRKPFDKIFNILLDKLNGDPLVALFFVAMAHALVVAVMISAGMHISGGHLNPAVTLGLLAGGHITAVRTILYWIDQLLASTAACALLKYLTGGLATPIHTLAAGVGSTQGVIMEIVLTLSLLFTVYTTIVDPKKGALEAMGPLLTGLVVGANIMAGGPFSGASMNPARSFGPALVSGDWTDHWVYWVGPLIGGGLAGCIYENFFIIRSHVPLSGEEDF